MIYAEVIGDPVAHSKSPLIHNFWLAKLGLAAEYRKTHVRPEELAAYLAHRREDANWRGCNITMPHKQAAVPLLDTISRTASQVSAVNCVYVQQERLIGENTDVDGVTEPLLLERNQIGGYPNHVATYVQIIGAGGAAYAAAAATQPLFDIEFYNRDPGKAQQLAERCGLPDAYANGLEAIAPIRGNGDAPVDQRYSTIVLNASAMGMRGNPPVPIRLQDYYPDTIVFDMVYDPLETPLLVDARRCGLRTIDGLQMLVAQAASAFQLFFGVPAPRQHDAELRALLIA